MEEHGGKHRQSSSAEMILRGIGGRGELGLSAIDRRRCDSTERWRGLWAASIWVAESPAEGALSSGGGRPHRPDWADAVVSRYELNIH